MARKGYTAEQIIKKLWNGVRVCPVNNIEMVDKKPVWQNRCESCLACINWCPKEQSTEA